MKLTFYSNYLNHHQVLVADELYKLLGENYHFVATLPRNPLRLKGGGDFSTRPYCILAGETKDAHNKALRLSIESDVCIFAASSQFYAVVRAKQCPEKLSFELGERWLKHGLLSFLSPVFRQWYFNYIRYFRKANFYKLCCSSFTAEDDEKLYAYRGKHYKWAYFTKVEDKYVVKSISDISKTDEISFMWCSRFLKLKHPELPILMASRLKEKGYKFHISMFGDEGIADKHEKVYSRAKLEKLIIDNRVEDCVTLMGHFPNSEILQAMRNSDIFLFTSDRLEGWGAVANEAMSNGCVLVASDEIGSTPYLIKDGENGFQFKSKNLDSLMEKVEWLLTHQYEMYKMQYVAYEQMKNIWNPSKAATSLLQLIDDLQNDRKCSLIEGPCSIA